MAANRKYFCPRRPEKTPSAHAYSDHFFCFGCGARGPLSELGLNENTPVEITYVENIEESIRAIKLLPKRPIRGFELHADDRGYYLLWNDASYYKRRVYGADVSSKYRGPSGHRKPPFRALIGSSTGRLALVEGEFNALSLAVLEPTMDVISPGGAGDFYSTTGQRSLPLYAQYGKVDIVVDDDAAGAQAAIEAKARLISLGCPDVQIHLVKKDFNDILTQEGKEALRDEAKRMGLL